MTASGTYTVPAGVHLLQITAWGGGASGGSVSDGGSGGFVTTTWYVRPGDTLTVSVGAGGPTNVGTLGTPGGDTTVAESQFNRSLLAPHGSPGTCCSNPVDGAHGAAGTVTANGPGAAFNTQGQPGSGIDTGLPGSGGHGGTFTSPFDKVAGTPGLVVLTPL